MSEFFLSKLPLLLNKRTGGVLIWLGFGFGFFFTLGLCPTNLQECIFLSQEFLEVGRAIRKRLGLDQALTMAVPHLCSAVVGAGHAIPDSDYEGSWSYLLFFFLLSHPYLTTTVLQKLLTNGK